MGQKTHLALLFIALLATIAVAAEDSSSSSSSEESKETRAIRQLLSFTMEHISRITEYIAAEGKNIFEKVVQELSPLKEGNEELRIKLLNFTEFIEDAGKLKPRKEGQPFQLESLMLSATFSEIMDAYNTTDTAVKPTIETALIWATITKNGLDALENGVETRFADYLSEFDKKFKEFDSSLTPTERQEYGKIFVWYNSVKNASTIDDKLNKFVDYLNQKF
ncbi:uncharacterized protein LOC115631217 [Scaptodrosophila lebanonensis]|uniref:Uncharacterized protein LOC115631217 n=1 Tax=Drosophila lebanonensis TaxID=7225 RepID=A0A6J2U9D6_DROLE|nr:uncharacterized protein LOC115631217 [Scaptodrosophila lebanonensis]